jgi:hypothetical protein
MPASAKISNLDKALERFAHNVPVNARRALMMKRKKVSIRSSWKKVGGEWKPKNSVKKSYMANTNASGRLANSLTGKYTGDAIIFEMEYYGQWVDQGRPPTKKQGDGITFKKSIRKWIDTRKLNLRDEGGKFSRGGKKALAFLIGRKIHTFGIPPTGFFTNTFNRAVEKLPFDIYDALASDMDIIIDKQNDESN